jgi:hypothetical protein
MSNLKFILLVTRKSFLFFCFFVVLNNAYATDYFVNDNSTAGDTFTSAVGKNTNNGTSPSSPKATLTNVWTTYGPAGTNVLTSGDVIYVDAGTYIQTDRDLNITVAIEVIGAGTELTIFDNEQSGTTGYTFMRVSAAVKLNDFKIYRYGRDATYAHAIHIHASVTGVELNNIHIDDSGRSVGKYPIEIESGASVSINGGGVTCNNNWLMSGGIRVVGATSILSINNYTFFNNTRSEKGVCLRQENGTVTINNSIFEENKEGSVNVHGVIYQVAGSLSINDCIFNKNSFEPDATYRGGTIALEGGSFHMRRSRITNTLKTGGSGRVEGGAIGVNGGVTAILDSCYFSGNQGPTTQGTDIHVRGSSATLTANDCTFGSSTNQVGTSSSGTIIMSYCGDPSVNTNTGSTTKNNTDSPRYTANPSLNLFSGDCGVGVVLPVELLSFNLECNWSSANLFWTTTSERNNDYFVIEKAAADGVFNRIAEIDGSGNSSEIKSYNFSDNYPLKGTSYYRLSQFDFNGEGKMLSTIILDNSCSMEEEKSTCFFNPLLNEFTIHSEFVNNIDYSIYIVDALGKKITQEQFTATSNLTSKNLKLNKDLSNALYFVIIEGNNKQESIKVVKY